MKCNQSRPGFELVSPGSFPTTITITPRSPPLIHSILLYGCTTWTLTKRLEKKLDGNYTRMLQAILNKSWQQHPTRHQLYGHLPPITKTIQDRRARHVGHCWRSKDELISDVFLWTPTYGQAKAGRPAQTYIQQLCEDMGCSPEDQPEAMNEREKWREKVKDNHASCSTRWWWHKYKYVKEWEKENVSGKMIYFRDLKTWLILFHWSFSGYLMPNLFSQKDSSDAI